MDIKFNAQNKKNIIIAGVFLLILILLSQFVYFPKSRQVRRLGSEYKMARNEIDELYDFIGGQENLKDNIVKMRKELAVLERAFPSEKEVSNIIKELNKEAKRFEVNVRSLKPNNLFIYRDSDDKELKISEYFCKCMPLILKVESRYQALGEFIASLETSRNPVISIDRVEIERDEDVAPMIRAEIDLNAFILGN